MEHLKLVIIDEISMCGTRMFCFINQRLQEITGISKPFGGVSIIAIGDLFQLKPVMDSWIFKQPSGKSTEILSENLWEKYFALFELTEIMRQKNDRAFAELLNRIREGNHTKADVDFFKTRTIDVKNSSYPTNATHLLYFNKKVDLYNNNLFQQAKGDKATIKAIDIVIGDIAQNIKEEIKHNAKDLEMGLSKVCCIAVEMRVEITVNLDLNDGLVNGAGGIVKKIEYLKNNVEKIWIQFEDEIVGKVGRYKSCKVARKQFPIRLAAAKTIHRSQGDTLQQVVIEFPTRRESHMHYVALSRAQKAEDIYIIGDMNAEKISVSQEVKEEMKRLRNERTLNLCYTPLYIIEDSKFKICFHNSQSLHLHIDDVKADDNFIASDVNMFVESQLCRKDKDSDYTIPGFQLYRNDFSIERTSYGSVIYIKDAFHPNKIKQNFSTIEITKLVFPFLQCFCVYA
ncbi:unnamed protein product [Mytilus coruscus]|uniref:ATP-dependent DNA helicase n=1 Tax=Mytilus coruscus TaxID=42192 RepID=A0A6J8CR92_MYTCO|nr:unnamed protein product [Mytilus coruscus]